MARIQTKFDHTLVQSDIIIGLTNSSKDEAGDHYEENKPEIQQTSIYGVQAPLIMVNNTVVDFPDILYFSLKCDGILPEVQMTVKERRGLLTTFDTPGIDNELRVQVLPKFDDKYKKINLTFYITSMSIDDSEEGIISISGSYKSPKFTSDQIKSFGEIDTYTLFETIAKEVGLGFASNIETSEEDKRWIYCPNMSYQNLLDQEIRFSSNVNMKILDYWIDPWNNLTLVDIYERYNAKDQEEDMMLWVTGQNAEITEGNKPEPMKTPAILNNHPSSKTSELYVNSYDISNSPGSQMGSGTDKLYSIYEDVKSEHIDHLIQDGATKKDIFTKFEYLGELYGEYNYLLSSKIRSGFLQKIDSNETITVALNYPLLGILRGNRVNFVWYKNDDMVSGFEENLKNEEIVGETQVSDPQINNLQTDGNFETDNGSFIIDKSVSGQYYINGWELEFADMKWKHILTLSRSTLEKPQIMNKKDE